MFFSNLSSITAKLKMKSLKKFHCATISYWTEFYRFSVVAISPQIPWVTGSIQNTADKFLNVYRI